MIVAAFPAVDGGTCTNSILPSGTKVREVAKSDVETTDEIGMGKNCRVYKGEWKSQNMTIAIKTLTTGDFVTKEVHISTAHQ